jgi:predicted ATPase
MGADAYRPRREFCRACDQRRAKLARRRGGDVRLGSDPDVMLKRLRLKNFKNFADAELSMGPFTLLVGANASGKSNLREALRFLHAMGRKYTPAEAVDEKWNAGERQWTGTRGGLREISFRGAPVFGVGVDFDSTSDNVGTGPAPFRYSIEIDKSDSVRPLRVESESLYQIRNDQTATMICAGGHNDDGVWQQGKTEKIDTIVTPVLRLMRFFDLDTNIMRRAAAPGQTTLTDRGENLSSVLHTLSENAATKAQLVEWLRLLTPMDVVDLRFEADVRGHIILMLVEKDGHAYSAYSASDGTLRFLGMLAALFSPEPGLSFFEEIENGLHPSRLRLLIDLIRSRTREGKVQVVATTHSPTLLSLLDEDMLQYASLVYRLEGEASARITRLLDVPDAARVLATHDRADLLATGWFEGMVEFAAVPPDPPLDGTQPAEPAS